MSFSGRGFSAVIGLLLLASLKLQADCSVTNLGIPPLPDFGPSLYKNAAGGLYPNGRNNPPADHFAAGLAIATEQIQPLDASGNADTNSGRIVLLSIGMSNTTQEWGSGFMPRANADPSKNPQLVIVDGAQGGQAATDWTNFNSATWSTVQTRLQNAGVTTSQVQVIWMKQARRQPTQAFPLHAQLLQTNLEVILRVAQQRYPNLKIAYLSSRTRSYATNVGGLNPEPFAYESAFSVRWLIQKQLNGDLNYDATKGVVIVPWLLWGPYLWADGTNPRSDGFRWLCSDLQTDFTHPSTDGRIKVGTELLAFFKTDPTATPWFLKKALVGQPPVCVPSADVTNGLAPLRVRFTANASDTDGPIRDYQWTFDDGTFSTNANPEKTFFTPGTYQARLTVADSSGNTARGAVSITVRLPGAALGPAVYDGNQIQFAVNGWSNLNHIIQASTDLTTWMPVKTNRGAFTFSEAIDSNYPARFYRALSEP